MLYANCFSTQGEPITAQGYVYRDELTMNMSSIYTKLIQEAGRLCDHYASDLIYSINAVERSLESRIFGAHYFGFREMGVDGNSYIFSRDPEEVGSEYRSMWRLMITFAKDNYYEYTVEAVLQRVRYSAHNHIWEQLKKGEEQ